MIILNSFFKQKQGNNKLPTLNLIKLHSVNLMYKQQIDFFSILERIYASGVLNESELLKIKNETNLKRQVLQDNFLIINIEKIEPLINKIQNNFSNFIEEKENTLLLAEKSISAPQRAINISNYFDKKLNKLLKNNQLNVNDIGRIKSQVDIYKAGLKRSFESTDIRSELKNDLLHDLLNDFYSDMCRLFSNIS